MTGRKGAAPPEPALIDRNTLPMQTNKRIVSLSYLVVLVIINNL